MNNLTEQMEQDQTEVIKSTTNIETLSDQVLKLREGLKKFNEKDYLLLTGDPAIIGVACSIVSDMTNGKFNLLKWDKQERKYYSIEIDLYQKDVP